MENSILKNIKQWAIENNWPFPCIVYKIDKNFPKSFHDVIINYIKSTHPTFEEKEKLEEFAIVFTPEHNVYLEFLNDGNRVIILEDHTTYSTLPGARVIREQNFLNDLKQLDSEYLDAFMATLPEEYRTRLGETTTLGDISKKVTKNILGYLDYWAEEKKQRIEKIFYIEADSAKNKTTLSHTPSYNQKRKNPEISFDDRKAVLDSYESEYEFEANASNTKLTYVVKVYNVKNINYKIIMEPKEGTKYTKIIHLDKEQLSQGEVRQIVIDSLELNRAQISQTPNITRHLHTDLEEYKRLLEYLLNDRETEISYVTKKKIEEAENTKKR